MTFFIFITILIFHYLHPHGYYRLLKSFELDQCFCGLMATYSYCCEFGRQVKSSPQQKGLLLVGEAEGSDFPLICKISLWVFFPSNLASNCLICMAASNFWINPAECELLYSALGDRLLLFQVTCAWASPEMKAGYWKGYWLLVAKTALTVTRSEQIILQRFQDPRSSTALLKVFKSLCREQPLYLEILSYRLWIPQCKH